MVAASQNEPLQDLITRTDARAIAAELLGPGKRSGRSIRYPAVWAGGDNPTRISVTEHGFYDFREGQGGNVLQLIQLALNLSRDEAIGWLRARMNGGHLAAAPGFPHTPDTATSEPPPGDWQATAREAVETAARYLYSDRPDARRALAYLHDLRGLTDDTIRAFHLGYNPGWHRLSYSVDGKPISLPPGIVIPYFEGGALWAVRVRSRVGNLAEALGIRPDHTRDGDELSKYLNLTGSKVNGPIFNGDTLHQRPGSDVLIVEGEFDAMLAQQVVGEAVTVVTLGPASSKLTKRGRDLLKAASRIYATLDNDEAGHKAAARLVKALPKPPVALSLPSGKDITEYVIEQNGDLLAWWQRHDEHPPTQNAVRVSRGGQSDKPSIRQTSDERETTTEPPAERPTEAPCYFTGGVPDSWRSALLNVRDVSALAYELITEGLRAGVLSPTDTFTFADLLRCNVALGWGVNDRTLRRSLESLEGVLLTNLETDKSQEIVSKSVNNSSVGRRAKVYRLNSLEGAKRALLELAAPGLYQLAFPAKDVPKHNVAAVPATISARMVEALGVDPAEAQQIADELNDQRAAAYDLTSDARRQAGKRVRRLYHRLAVSLEDMASTPLPAGWKPRDLSRYRAAFLRGWMSADPAHLQCSRRDKMRLLGISNSSVDAYTARAGIIVTSPPEGEFERCPLPDGPNVEKAVRQGGYEVKGRPMKVIACTAEGREVVRAYTREAVCEFAAALRAAGAQLFVEYQVANRHEVDPNATPESAARARRAAPEPTEKASSADHQEAGALLSGPPSADEPRPTDGYRSDWVEAQLELGLRLMRWQTESGRFMNPNTGEVAPFDASATELIGLMLGRRVETVGALASLLRTGERLGAVVKEFA